MVESDGLALELGKLLRMRREDNRDVARKLVIVDRNQLFLKISHVNRMRTARHCVKLGFRGNPDYLASIMSRKWFSHPPVCVMDWAKVGVVRQVTSIEAA